MGWLLTSRVGRPIRCRWCHCGRPGCHQFRNSSSATPAMASILRQCCSRLYRLIPLISLIRAARADGFTWTLSDESTFFYKITKKRQNRVGKVNVNFKLDSLRWFSQCRSRTPHVAGCSDPKSLPASWECGATWRMQLNGQISSNVTYDCHPQRGLSKRLKQSPLMVGSRIKSMREFQTVGPATEKADGRK